MGSRDKVKKWKRKGKGVGRFYRFLFPSICDVH